MFDSKEKLFMEELEKLCLEHKFVLNGWLTDCKPGVIGLPGHGDFMMFISALRSLYLKHELFIDCTIMADLLTIETFTVEEDINEIRLNEMIEFSFVEWSPELMISLQAYTLALSNLLLERRKKGFAHL